MKVIKVKDLMVPLADYATVSEEGTLYDAVVALEQAQEKFEQIKARYAHRAILVYDRSRRIVGKLSQLDVIRGLEPQYKEIGDFTATSRFGFTPEFVKSLMKNYSLWDRPMQDICRKATTVKVKDIMYTPTEGEYLEEGASLDQAIHQLIVGHHQSLLVTRDREIVGILRLTDVFKEICQAIKECKI